MNILKKTIGVFLPLYKLLFNHFLSTRVLGGWKYYLDL